MDFYNPYINFDIFDQRFLPKVKKYFNWTYGYPKN